MTSSERVREFLAAQPAELRENEPGTRADGDPESLHKMRVATRRARSALRIGGEALGDERSERLRSELSWLGDVLGVLPDIDVLVVRLRVQGEGLEQSEQDALKPIYAGLSAERKNARAALTRALNGKRYATLLADLEEATVQPGGEEKRLALDARAANEFDKLAKVVKSLGRNPSDEELHRARIRGKRARYAAELAAPFARLSPDSFLMAAKAFQDVLGEHQDAVVLEERLRTLAAGSNGETSFAAGRLVEQERERRQAARAEVPRAWKRLERAGKRAWR
jgi:CHAD domain-containing protein